MRQGWISVNIQLIFCIITIFDVFSIFWFSLLESSWENAETKGVSVYVRIALIVMPPILLCCVLTSEMDVDGMAVERSEPYHQSITYFCFAKSCKMVSTMKRCTKQMQHWIPPCGKQLYPLTFVNASWMFMKAKQWIWA